MGTDKTIKISRKKLIGAAILLILGAAVLFLPGFTGRNGRIKTVPLKNDSEYRVFYEDQIPFGTIGDRDWFVADGRIFVLFEKRSYLSVYDPDGAFLYSIQTYHINNGRERIAYRDGQLIIHTRSGGIYLFDGPEKKEYIPWDRDNEDERERNRAYYTYIEHEFNPRKLDQGANYYLENNTIYRLTDEGEGKAVLSFPYLGWEFLFLGANMDAVAAAEGVGIRRDRAVKYVQDPDGMALNYRVLSDTLCDMRAPRPVSADWKAEIEADEKRRG